MATPKGKPVGYFQYVLAIDCETTGLCFSTESPVHNPKTGERHQTVSWGVIVADAMTLEPVEELYLEIQWNDESVRQREKNPQFGKKAEEVHGLTKKYLENNGVSEEEAVVRIAEIILKYWGPTVAIRCLGHNVHLFDVKFMRDLFQRFDIELKFGNRHVDTFSAGFLTFGTWNSNDLFDVMGFEERGKHNALDDIKMTLKSAQTIRTVFQRLLKGD